MKLARSLLVVIVAGSVAMTGCTMKEAAIGAGAAALTYGIMKHDKKHDSHNVRDEQRRWDDENGYEHGRYGHHHHHPEPQYDAPNWDR